MVSNLNQVTNPKPTALVTGGSDGIGFELAKLFVENDYDVAIVADNTQKLANAAQKLKAIGKPGRVEIITADLSTPEGPQVTFDKAQELGLNVGILVNNAGVGTVGEFIGETFLEDELAMIRLNIISVVHLTKLFVPKMVERRYGKILITASMAGLTSTPLMTVYGATKAFDYAFAEGLRNELKDKGVTVTALLPGGTDTNFFSKAGAEDTEIAQNKDKLADPADVAKDGFDALMAGKDHVISGFKNKLSAAAANILPKEFSADQARMKHAKK